MNSKMTLMAVLVAGLFSASALAAPVYNGNQIYSGDGYLDVDDSHFQTALKAANNGKVWLSTHGDRTDDQPYGYLNLTLTNPVGYELDQIRFAENSGIKKLDKRKTTFRLENTRLMLTDGIYFANAAASSGSNGEGASDLPSSKELTVRNQLFLSNTVLKGDVVNYYQAWVGGKYTNNSTSSMTDIVLKDGSQWYGDFKDVISVKAQSGSSEVTQENVHGVYNIELAKGSNWVGGVSIAENSIADVKLDMTSSWTVNKDSKVNSVIQFGEGAKSAQSNGLVLQKEVTLTIANSKEASSIVNLKSELGSSLVVEQAQVRIANASGNTNVVLNDKAEVKVDVASDRVTAKFNSLEGTKFTTADNVKADVEVSGKLVDAKGMEAVIAEFNKNQSYDGKGTVLFSGGFIANDRIGYVGADGKFVQTASTTNAKLVSIGESTAVTMMQWRADTDDMAQRTGELRNNDGAVGLWVRTYGGKSKADHVSNKYNGIQVGADTQIGAEGVKHFVGGAFSYTKGDADFVNGSGDNYMASLTGYSSWIYEGGSYLDVFAKWGKLGNDFDIGSADAKLAGKFNTHGVAMSVETGHRFPVGTLAYVEPQLAFTASHISGESYQATQDIKIEQDSIDSYVGRVGVQAGLNCPDNVGTLFVRASYLYDFDGETSTKGRSAVNQSSFDQDFGGGWYELGVGMNVNFTKNFYGYADFEYVSGGEIKTPYRWNAGVRYTF